MRKRIIAIIPARMASTRFPGKPIIDICGMPMIRHVWHRIKLNSKIDSVYVATCDSEIKKSAEAFGAKVIMTSKKHVRCTDRVTEACKKIIRQKESFDIVVNIQGDEPMLNPKAIDLAIKPFYTEKGIHYVNLAEKLGRPGDIKSYNNVKVVFDNNNFAIYFSRLPIPNGKNTQHYKQLGIYALTKQAILQYSSLPQGPLEIAESDDTLRFVENGIPVKIVLSPFESKGVDTPSDKRVVEKLLTKDKIFKMYNKL